MLPRFLRYNQMFAMSVTTFQEKLAVSGARLGMYRGAESAASFGDPGVSFARCSKVRPLRHELAGQAGARRRRPRALAEWHGHEQHSRPGAQPWRLQFCPQSQGRNQGDLVAYNRGDYLLVTTDREQAPKLAEIFDRYIIMDDVEVEDISDKLCSDWRCRTEGREILMAAGIESRRSLPAK